METMRSRNISKSVFILILVTSLFSSVISGDIGGHSLGWIPGPSACQGTIAECIGGDEFDLASESSRRILATSGYISYDALKRGSVPCDRRGASYYNCRPGAEANPYSRGCSAITQCRGG
ncbi:protein RALF-like 33 [Phalaenopsis equestris]|uniref:protein RALF-like 33 n=1 Tax=Phalaenopsis equestris TaxID=78828 RepID=UPI0009E3B00D|nr:protein RALF-like 33 [Phalaenopsis equestris]